jgi:hypothetical protein
LYDERKLKEAFNWYCVRKGRTAAIIEEIQKYPEDIGKQAEEIDLEMGKLAAVISDETESRWAFCCLVR